jgi:hypothetical protein
MYSHLVVCGIGSFIYHLTGYWFASLLDGFPMIFMTSMGLLIMIWDFTYENRNSNRLSAGLSLLLVLYYQMTLIVSATYVNYTAFTIMFAAPLIPINAFMIYYYNKPEKIPGSWDERLKMQQICKYAWITGIIGFVTWILDQVICDLWHPIAYFLGHVWWHIGIGYFAMSMIAFSSYLLANNFKYRAHVIYIWKIFPIVEWTKL